MEVTTQKPLLKNLREFEEAIAGYRPSDASLRTLNATRLTVLVGLSSSGRDTVINELVRTGDYHPIITNTTRSPRINNGILERDGVEYWFMTEEEVLEGLRQGKYLEAEIIHGQQVSGTPISEIEAAHEKNLIAITDVDIGGGNALHDLKPDTVSVLLLPPGFDEWIRRLQARGELPDDEVKRRMQTAVTVISDALAQDFYHFVINRDLDETVRIVHELSTGLPPDTTLETEAKSLAVQLEIDVRLYLEGARAA
jgi:guanylate kinase